ncbi:MAG: hypothetical protein ACI9W6_002624, partial [Motiliproteus sp.]
CLLLMPLAVHYSTTLFKLLGYCWNYIPAYDRKDPRLG